jgi:hypothetical protein
MKQNLHTRDRTAKYRASLRQAGLRPVQLWVPDTRAPGFGAKARAECERINAADKAENMMAWLEDVSLFDDHDAR